MYIIRLLSIFFAVAAAGFAQDTTGTGSLSGSVAEAGIEVCLEGSGRCVQSGPGGSFRLSDLRAGIYTLVVDAPGRPPVRSEGVEIRAGLESRLEITLPQIEAVQQSITVTEAVFSVPEEVKNSAFLVQPNEILKSAGALQDISRYLQTLPGVLVGSNDFRNDIIVRGGSPVENLFVVDNIEVPNINSFANFASAGGTVSILDPALIADTTFLTGGYPAPYINRASSVLQITQREGARDRLQGRATVGFAGAGGVLEGPINQGRGSWVVSARRSFLDFFTDDIGIGGVPVNYSINAKVVYDLSPRDRIWAANLSGWDDIRLGARESSTGDEELDNQIIEPQHLLLALLQQ
ncbi:MAG TPA: TonB-dependent receptor, partial [Bryobacteraceae bacterium]|nr:TonB-dependent receptor [Bryobacteraceae bacterium]